MRVSGGAVADKGICKDQSFQSCLARTMVPPAHAMKPRRPHSLLLHLRAGFAPSLVVVSSSADVRVMIVGVWGFYRHVVLIALLYGETRTSQSLQSRQREKGRGPVDHCYRPLKVSPTCPHTALSAPRSGFGLGGASFIWVIGCRAGNMFTSAGSTWWTLLDCIYL